MYHFIAILALTLMAAVQNTPSRSTLDRSINSSACHQWVDSVYNSMDLSQRVGQMMMVNVSPTQGAQSRSAIRTMVETNQVGGLFFSKGTAAQFAEMTNYAQSISRVPLLMGIDGEWGPSMRVSDAPDFPFNMGLGAIRNPDLLYRYGLESARQFKALGIYLNFGPVLDVNNNPANPVIGYRSFGEDPFYVGKLGKAYALGLESGGVMSCAKHFPGHGDTENDSHKTLPTITHNEEVLDSVDLVPFSMYINANLSGVMVGHLNVPALDNSGRPSSMSAKVVNGVLRDEMGFDGLVFTDGLGMKGAAVKENLCVAAIRAGNDVMVGPTNVAKDIAAVVQAVKDGTIPAESIERSCKKILAYKYALGLTRLEPVDAKRALSIMNSSEAQALQQQLADAEITVLGNSSGILPIGNLAKNSVAVVNIGEGADNEFARYCQRYTDVECFSDRSGLSAATVSRIAAHNTVIAAVYNDNAAAVASLNSLRNVPNLVVVTFVTAYKLSKFKTTVEVSKALMLAYDNSKYAQRAAAMALFGGIEVNGKLPVNIPGIGRLGQGVVLGKSRLGYSSPAAKGMRSDLVHRMDSAMAIALGNGAFPGAQVLVVKDGDVIVDRSYGNITKGGDKVAFNTIYDLASVSKVVGTLPGVMKAYDLDLFELDTPASRYIPGLNVPGKSDVTPRMLLFHETGMPASMNMFEMMMDTATYKGRVVSSSKDATHTIYINGGGYGHNTAQLRTDILSPTRTDVFNVETAKGIYTGDLTYDSVMTAIYRIGLKPSRNYLYSCLNFCLLMDMEQRITGVPHREWITDSIWAPLGAYTMCYRPTEKFPLKQIAATEEDTYLRKQHMHGYVHDELADFSGGIQGNAGVFGNANDIAKLCQMWLNGGWYGDARVLSDETVRLFTKTKSPNSRRGLGFDKPDMKNPDNSPTCDEASAATYGHTGFTGTCFWVDPKENLIFVFLSNRVDPSRNNPAFAKSHIRGTLMSMVYDAL